MQTLNYPLRTEVHHAGLFPVKNYLERFGTVSAEVSNRRRDGTFLDIETESEMIRSAQAMIASAQAAQASLLPIIQAGQIHIPAEHSKERQGHIFWNPKQFGFDKPAVGVDQEIFEDWVKASACEEIVFVVYRFGKIEIERWRIAKDKFLSSSKRVQTSETFVPQQMISVTHLELGGETVASFNNPFSKL